MTTYSKSQFIKIIYIKSDQDAFRSILHQLVLMKYWTFPELLVTWGWHFYTGCLIQLLAGTEQITSLCAAVFPLSAKTGGDGIFCLLQCTCYVNVKHFVFDLSCDVTGDLLVNFLSSCYRSSRPGLSIDFWIFPPHLLVTEIVGRGRYTPLQHRAGVGLCPAGRGLRHFVLFRRYNRNPGIIPQPMVG